MTTTRPAAADVVRDVALASAVCLTWSLIVWALSRSSWWHPRDLSSYYWTGVLLTLAVALRRASPRTGLWIVVVLTVLVQRAGLPTYFHVLPLAVAAFTVVRAGAMVWASTLAIAAATGMTLLVPGYPDVFYRLGPDRESPVAQLLPGHGSPLWASTDYSSLAQLEALLVAAVLLGHVVRRLEVTRAELENRHADLLALQGIEAERAVTAERNRIARDLHDVVAHHVTAIVVRAQAARHVAARRPEAGGEALEWIVTEGKDALGAMRSMVHLLRVDSAGSVPTGLHTALETSADRMRAGGLHVRLDVEAMPSGADDPCPETTTALVRIAQEALTNVALHSAASSAEVVMTRSGSPERVRLVVTDPGPRIRLDAPPREGNGLHHMQARAAEVGGSLLAGPDGGGWRVEADLPARSARLTGGSGR